jgi:hypothetical protein
VVPLDAFLHFLGHFQKEHCTDEEAKQLVEVSVTMDKIYFKHLIILVIEINKIDFLIQE